MLSVYLFSLVLGGGFLAASLLGDVLGGGVDVDAGGETLEDHSAASRIFSFRTAVYALFGFGVVGATLTWLGSDPLPAAAFALVGGATAGLLIHLGFRFLKRTETGAHAGDVSFVGLPGTVTLPLSPTTPGQVAVERGSRRIVLRALPHATRGEPDPSQWRSVVIVEMSDGVARVAPVDEDLAEEA